MELNLQLNTLPQFNRDMTVELTNQATGQIKQVKPYLDGKVVARNVDPGQWRVAVKHPNILFNLYDKPVRVFRDRPTFIPIRIPENIFSNAPIADTPEANLTPVKEVFDNSEAAASAQANKLAGQPIYSDDWNEMAGTIADLSKANSDLTDLVSPIGHDHPELVTKMEEIQANLQRFYDLFGRSLAQLQRQVQQLALQRKVDAAVGEVEEITPDQRSGLDLALGDLSAAWFENPAIYSSKKKRAGEQISQILGQIVTESDTPVSSNPVIVQAQTVADAMATERSAIDYAAEIEQQNRVDDRSEEAPFYDALRGFGGIGQRR